MVVDNATIVKKLSDYANELDAMRSQLYRVRAYRQAAETIRRLEQPLSDILDREGRRGLRALPGIGDHIAFTLEELLRTGEFRTWRDAHPEMTSSGIATDEHG
jgi:DNA polymerase/3'-5' exonuclease PolX